MHCALFYSVLQQGNDGKSRRRQRDNNSPVPASTSTPDNLPNRLNRASVVSRKVANMNIMELSRRNSISDKGRKGEKGPPKISDFVNSDTDSSEDAEVIRRRNRTNQSSQFSVSKNAQQSARRFSTESDEGKMTDNVLQKRIDKENDSGKDSERERDSDRDRGRDRNEWDPKAQERETIRSRSCSLSSTQRIGSGRGAGGVGGMGAGGGIERPASALHNREREREREKESDRDREREKERERERETEREKEKEMAMADVAEVEEFR